MTRLAHLAAAATMMTALAGCAEIAPGVTQYFWSSEAPSLPDEKGGTIPTSPDAYDVSSATGKKS